MRRLQPPEPPDWHVVVLPIDRVPHVPRGCCVCGAANARHRRRVRIDLRGATPVRHRGARSRVELWLCRRCHVRHLLMWTLFVASAGATAAFAMGGVIGRRWSIIVRPIPDWSPSVYRAAVVCVLVAFACATQVHLRLQVYAVGDTIRYAFPNGDYAARFAIDNAPVLESSSQ